MRVLFDHQLPFLLAHGGFQNQIAQTMAALRNLGVAGEPLRWWDPEQEGEVLHFFGRPRGDYIQFAQSKGMRVVIEPLLTGAGSRRPLAVWLQKLVIANWRRCLPEMLKAPFAWEAFTLADACVANTPWEARLMTYLFQAPPERVHVVPNGVEEVFLHGAPVPRGSWLVCSATITERKRVLELAEAARRAQTPLWIIGKPFDEQDAYARRFLALARGNASLIRYEGPVNDRQRLATIYREARGFVLLSTAETRSLSAEEAAACGCPLLLSDLPWARSVFQENATYCPVAPVERTAAALGAFYAAAPGLKPPPKPHSWPEVARQFLRVYEAALAASQTAR